MFGYVKPRRPELKVKEDMLYRAAYCGLCRTMGKTTGCLSRLFLSYDIVLLLLTRIALEKTETKFEKRRCLIHPLRPRLMMEPNATAEYSAVVTALLAHDKAADNISDERGLRRLAARGVRRILVAALHRGNCPDALAEAARESLSRLAALEAKGTDSIDDCADTFGETLSAVFAYGLTGAEARIAAEVGRHVGRVLYVLDAADDFEKDQKSGSFNPLVNAYGKALPEAARESLSVAVRMDLSDADAALALIDFSHCRDVENVIKNILSMGIPDEAERILAKNGEKSR